MMEPAVEHYLNRYQALAGNFPGDDVDWVAQRRGEGLARFGRQGFPSQREEDWRYTSLRSVTSALFEPIVAVASATMESLAVPEKLGGYRLVFVDGCYLPEQSDMEGIPGGITIEPLSSVLEQRPQLVRDSLHSVRPTHSHGFTALNDAFNQDGVVVILEDGAVLDQPLEILHMDSAADTLVQPRHLLVAGANSRASIIERYVSCGTERTLTNSVSELLLAADAHVDYYLVQTASTRATHISGIWARQMDQSRLALRTLTLGGALVRNELRTDLAAAGAHCDMLGLYCPGGRQHVDNHTTMVHSAPHCTSRELYRGVLEQRSRAVFHGRIKVSPGAAGTDAEQANNNLLLSRDAEIDTKPQLEIYADDVKCAHGATVGQIDPDSLFYLRARGIDEEQARAMLTFAFVNDVVAGIGIESLQALLEQQLANRLIKDENSRR